MTRSVEPDLVTPADVALTRALAQPVLLAPRPRRLDLLRLPCRWPTVAPTVRVHRNHGFEVVSSVWRPFCAYAGLDVVPVLGPYDDTLDLAGDQSPADLHVVSLDFERYRLRTSVPDLLGWLVGRVDELARRSGAPVLVTNWPAPDAGPFNDGLADAVDDLPGVVVGDVASLAGNLGANFLDPRRSEVSGTPWSAVAAVAVAREFGLRWLPALLSPPVKAAVVDLDGTLYDGVLGEDGASGVRVDRAHLALQEHLVSLRERGVFLGVVSRNEPGDVEELFRARPDFPLRWELFSAAAVGWGSKADGLAEVAEQLRIGTDAIAYLDDNAGELATVASSHPGTRTLHAADPDLSRRSLLHCPGLFRFRATDGDARRIVDLAATRERTAHLRAAPDPEAYLRSLQVELRCRLDHPDDAPRAAEISSRTNQFSTSMLRLSEAELARRRRDGSVSWVAVSLRDRLADSGTIAAVFGRREGARLVVEGISISCRALGRRIETAVVEAALLLLAADGVREVAFRHATGPRNAPAREWLGTYCAAELGPAGLATVAWDPAVVRSRADRRPVAIVEGRHDAE